MLMIPITIPKDMRGEGRDRRGPVVVFMILEKENLDRMKESDPFDVQFRAYRGHMPIERPISDLDFVLAYEEDVQPIKDLMARGDIEGILQWIQRGRVHRPSDAMPPISLRQKADQ